MRKFLFWGIPVLIIIAGLAVLILHERYEHKEPMADAIARVI